MFSSIWTWLVVLLVRSAVFLTWISWFLSLHRIWEDKEPYGVVKCIFNYMYYYLDNTKVFQIYISHHFDLYSAKKKPRKGFPPELNLPFCRPQEIDGQALLLLTLPAVQEFLELKLGPAVKLCHEVERVKVAFFEQYAGRWPLLTLWVWNKGSNKCHGWRGLNRISQKPFGVLRIDAVTSSGSRSSRVIRKLYSDGLSKKKTKKKRSNVQILVLQKVRPKSLHIFISEAMYMSAVKNLAIKPPQIPPFIL